MLTNIHKIFGGAALLMSLLFSHQAAFAHEFADITTFDNVNRSQFGLAISENSGAALCLISTDGDTVLKYASEANAWATEDVAAGLNSTDECVIIFQNDTPHIIYSDHGDQQLKHAKKVADDWVISVIDADFDSNMDISMTRSFSAAVSPDQTRLAVAYHDGDVEDLKYAEYIDNVWNTQALVSDGDQGTWPALVFSQSNEPIIAFTKNWRTTAELWLIEENDAAWSAATQHDASGDAGSYTHIAVDGSNRLHLAYRAITAEGEQQLRYGFREDGVWQDTIDVSSHSWNWLNGTYMSMTVDADGNAFFLHNWEFLSALFPDASYLEMISIYFASSQGIENYSSATDTVDVNVLRSFYYSETALQVDTDYNMYFAYITDDDNYTLRVQQISSWTPAATLLTPNAEANDVDENNQFTFQWLDFDPDSNSYIRLKWRDADWNYTVFEDNLRENDANSALVTLEDVPSGEWPIILEISNNADFSMGSSSLAPSNLSIPEAEVVAEDAPAEEEPAEEVVGEDDAPEDEAGIDPLRESGQSNSDEPGAEDEAGNDAGSQASDVLAAAAAAGCSLNAQAQNNSTTTLYVFGVFVLASLFRTLRFKFRNARTNK